MNGRQLLEEMGDISLDFIQEAEQGQIRQLSGRRLAAVIAAAALAMLLVGCAVVYVLRMANLKVGESQQTRDVFATDGSWQGQETVAQQVLTFSGIKGSRNYQASREWFEFCRDYDPDNKIRDAAWEAGFDLPDKYMAYDVYTEEMTKKLEEIAEEYGLQLLGEQQGFRTAKGALKALGLDDVFVPESGVSMEMLSLSCYQGGNFGLTGTMHLPENIWPHPILTVISYHDKAYLSTAELYIDDDGSWREWNYTTAAGDEVLILRSEKDWRAWIFCDRGDATITARIEAVKEIYSDRGRIESIAMTDRQLELTADAIDFSMEPNNIDPESDFAGLEAVGDGEQNGYRIEVKSAVTDGWVAYITLGVTGPEDTVLIDPEEETYGLTAGNWSDGLLQPKNGEKVYGSMSMGDLDDRDGLENTTDLLITMTFPEERKQEEVWNLYFEDLVGTWWDRDSRAIREETVAEGVWSMDITFDYSRAWERELITEPIRLETCVGWAPDGSNVYEEVTVDSFVLRAFSATVSCQADCAPDFSNIRGGSTYVAMKDGRRIRLWGMGARIGAQELHPEGPIDLTEADYVILGDGTILEIPETY